MITFKINTSGSHAFWQMTARDTNRRIERDDNKPVENGCQTYEIDKSETGYFFQYNGQTAYLLNYNDNDREFSYRTSVDIEGLSFKRNKIIFNTVNVKLRIPKNSGTDVTHSIERDDLEKYLEKEELSDDKTAIYNLKILKGARFFILGRKEINNQILDGSGFFKLLIDGNISKYISVRANSIKGVASDFLISDAYFAGLSRKKKPIIVANAHYWKEDLKAD